MADRSKEKHIQISNNPEKVSVPVGRNLCPLHKEATLGLLKWHIYKVGGWDTTVLVPPYLQPLLWKRLPHVHLFTRLFHLVPQIHYHLYSSDLEVFPEHHTNIQMPSTWMSYRYLNWEDSKLRVPTPYPPAHTLSRQLPRAVLPHLSQQWLRPSSFSG